MLHGFVADTKILMHDGSIKNIQDIVIGDKLMGANSTEKIVNEINEEKVTTYNIIPVKGNKITVPKDHLLILKTSNCEGIAWNKCRQWYSVSWISNFAIKAKHFPLRDYKTKDAALEAATKFFQNEMIKQPGYTSYGSVVKISIDKFIKLPGYVRHLYKLFSTGIVYDEVSVDIDPYILGYWLGDGCRYGAVITTAEKEVIDYFKVYASNNNLQVKYYSGYSYGITSKNGKIGGNPFLNALKKYDLIHNKHIPNDYKMNSRENQLKLLAGLIDSDGHYSRNTYDFTFKTEKLVDDIIFVARSLGFKCFKTKCQKTCTNSSNGRVTGTYYRFVIYGEGLEEIPSLLKRKQAHPRMQRKNATVSGFKIEKAEKNIVYSIKTNGNNRILLDDFTVVHT